MRCRAGVVQNRLLESGALRPGQAVAIVWGRVYREGDEVLVQTYLRFLRVDPDARGFADERFAVALTDPQLRLGPRQRLDPDSPCPGAAGRD